ncbi:uncharacterized protein LOC130895611 [Diorhabda carinulata]|uniref:uncharacterized protein LOC130895611 n=1 Tax=Diorhabda carinulata TaxID=1163345 RepID=UPI00259FF3D3|nr:uncharacterized protein LOC130895611 [Diorhabda carinulata]
MSLLLLLPQQNDGTPENIPKKRNTDESFSINLGAGYGIGFEQNNHNLPNSTVKVKSTNFLPALLKNEAVIVGQPLTKNENFQKVDINTVESRNTPFPNEPNTDGMRKGVMDLKQLQQIIHNVDNSEYSKIIQVVKVPAVYEIHLEKVSQKQNKLPKNSKQSYIHQINNLISKPKKKTVTKNTSKSKDYINIDKWRAERDKVEKQKNENPSNIRQPFSSRPAPMNTANKNIVLEEKNTNFSPSFYPFNQPYNTPTDVYRAPQTNLFSYEHPEIPIKKPIYSTLTHTVPYNIRRQYQERSETIPEDLVYGTQKEKVLNPGEINITMQPGSTIIRLPKVESENHRRFIENEVPKTICEKERSMYEPIHDISDNVYFTTVKPIEKRIGLRNRSPVFSKKLYRRSDNVPMEYILYIKKEYHDGW